MDSFLFVTKLGTSEADCVVSRIENPKIVMARSRRRGQTLTYQVAFKTATTVGTRNITFGNIGVDLSRPCKVQSVKLEYSSNQAVGSIFSFTLNEPSSAQDAAARSLSMMVTPYPRSITLSNPGNVQMGYVAATDAAFTIVHEGCDKQGSDSNEIFFLATVKVVFSQEQTAVVAKSV